MASYPAPASLGPHGPGPSRPDPLQSRPDGVPVAMLHGFGQTAACLGPMAEDLAESFQVLLVDAPGHGAAGAYSWMDCPTAADALVEAIGPANWVGYSMGGRIALNAAVRNPHLVGSLVLISATAGIEDHDRRSARRLEDHRRAEHLERVGVVEFNSEWLAMDMFCDLPPWARFESERGSNSAAGLAGSLRNAGTGSMAPLWDRLQGLSMPVLCVAGRRDAKFVAAARAMADAIGDNCETAIIDGAGHAAHLEAPEAVTTVVADFLRAPRPGPSLSSR